MSWEKVPVEKDCTCGIAEAHDCCMGGISHSNDPVRLRSTPFLTLDGTLW